MISIKISNWWQILILPTDVVAIEVQPLKYLQQVVQNNLSALCLGQLVEHLRQDHHVLFVLVPHGRELLLYLLYQLSEVGTVKVQLTHSRELGLNALITRPLLRIE